MRVPRLCGAAASVLLIPQTTATFFLPAHQREYGTASRRDAIPDADVLDQMADALQVMQEAYFEPWLGTWPKSIDWTAAVLGTHVSAAMNTLTKGLSSLGKQEAGFDFKAQENLITAYFSQILSFYFGQDALSLRHQAFDDILWVVLGWLETIQFIDLHTALHYPPDGAQTRSGFELPDLRYNQTWHGNLWIPAFAHRARIFWDLSSRGWDTRLCGGGMTWNPRLAPYKNAITNELFIAASASMYLYFPGDDNTSPFNNAKDAIPIAPEDNGKVAPPHDPKHLSAAVAGHDWLTSSGMMNDRGLYMDGFHISGWDNVSHPGTKCDQLDTQVYTYNQGVLLTGLLGLFKVTGNDRYLREGHKLIQSVINATGYDLANKRPRDSIQDLGVNELPKWQGLGRAGILEEMCDVSGQCSQNSHTFKGIFFHHMTTFCAPLATADKVNGGKSGAASKEIRLDHASACGAYVDWIQHNAMAALQTRDEAGKFGMWWTAGILNLNSSFVTADVHTLFPRPNEFGTDYRTYGIPNNDLWMLKRAHAAGSPGEQYDVSDQVPIGRRSALVRDVVVDEQRGFTKNRRALAAGSQWDPNTRGRGRTVETQSGGMAVLRALWEISRHSAR